VLFVCCLLCFMFVFLFCDASVVLVLFICCSVCCCFFGLAVVVAVVCLCCFRVFACLLFVHVLL